MDEGIIALIVGGIMTALAVVYGLQVIVSINRQIDSLNRLRKRIRRMKNDQNRTRRDIWLGNRRPRP